ncbi:SpoIIE family protein phosphatase [Actinoplanes sp. NEAU-A12]|uniref:SpoIIE family protein phosphatase n=1 Tax=Actinoplanes sandaracinus TaxID=3045177 RepID=A0ABT6WRC6_9ACTN|nr:SpoIIE family protein phosphatase [Actinoplanes sandaracinus]MDI6102254.1 SpoIIE family protein phosphatase [Actinoplanes sandaracinus]
MGGQAYARTASGLHSGAGWGWPDGGRGAVPVTDAPGVIPADGRCSVGSAAGCSGVSPAPGGRGVSLTAGGRGVQPLEAGRVAVERAVGLLAGRARCRLSEAHRHLLRMAAERRCDVTELAGRVIRLLDNAEAVADRPSPETLPQLVAAAMTGAAVTGPAVTGPAVTGPAGTGATPVAGAAVSEAAVSQGMSAPAAATDPVAGPGGRVGLSWASPAHVSPAPALTEADPARRFTPWLATVQDVLDSLPGMSGYLTAERDDAGRLADLVWAAASPEAMAPDGRRGSQLLGLPVSRFYPELVADSRWEAYQRVLDTGEPADVGPVRVGEADFTLRAGRLGPGLLVSWERLEDADREADRIDGMEQLGNLGWGEWDLVSGEIYWSPQLYRIYERDPALGPLGTEEADAIAVADDQPLRMAALEAFQRSERVDVLTRVWVSGRVKHLRTIADAVRDAEGRPLRIYGVVQDVTEQQAGAERLAEVERTLAAEHDLAARLQRIILPIPSGPIDLPGVRAAVRYLPAGQETNFGGDWFHAAALRDGSVLLAVGDVAGHGTHAATTMAQLRHALRALAVTTSDPGILLEHLNRLTCDLEAETPELAATAVIARFDPARHELVWAQAGHPPPLLCRGGRTTPMSRPAGPMLGVVDDARYASATTTFVPGDVLLLYTDGLVEHRRRGLDVGLEAVITTVDDAVRVSPEQPLGELLARLRRANPDDDTCILAARPTA